MRWLFIALLLWLPMLASAQGTATLVADTVFVDGQTVLSASGNVQVFYDGATLSAASVTYNQATDQLTIGGPIYIRTRDGTILTADQADLDPRLENGILRGARLVLNQQLQLAANRIDRVDGRFSQLTRTAATSCTICGDGPPLWEIRADRVVHDELEQQIYFDNASFLVRGVPVLWLPRMRLPDPTLERATGLLIPRVRSNNLLGLGIKLPYFIRIGDSRDLTLTPFWSVNSRTLEARYRQAFLNGTFELNGAISRDTIINGSTRSYVFAEGSFDIGRGFTLAFDVEAVSDPAYLLDYGYSNKDRLDSAISLIRVRQDDLFVADITYYNSLRDDEVNATLPPIVANLSYERRMSEPFTGGRLTLGTSLDALTRTGDTSGALGRDVIRAGVWADWNNSWILPAGLVVSTDARLAWDYYDISQDAAFENGLRQSGAISATLRWPLAMVTQTGATHIIEPVLSAGWSGNSGVSTPNEDGSLAEFDEGNLFGLTRFPGEDSREIGSHTSLGLSWTRRGPGGTTSVLSFGRIFQSQPQTGFSPTSGLSQQNTDWLISGHLEMANGLVIDTRALFDDSFEFDKTESRLGWSTDRFDLQAAYHWLPRDPTRDRLDAASEWSFDASYQYSDAWRFSLDGRYDVATDAPRAAGVGVEWRNECVTVDLSVSRRYTSSETVDPATDYGFSVSLNGFSAGRSQAAPVGSCYD